MQPTYLPWAGYFDLMASVDTFVFLDDVQFERRSWQCRNRVIVDGHPVWLTVPVVHVSQSTMIRDIEINDGEGWRDVHVGRLRHAFARHPHRSLIEEFEDIVQDRSIVRLADLNASLIRRLAARLNLSPRFAQSSELDAGGKRSEKLVNLCKAVDCSVYLSPPGSAAYLEEDASFGSSGVELRFQAFDHRPYPQIGVAGFESHLSVLDLIANQGWEEAQRYVTVGAT